MCFGREAMKRRNGNRWAVLWARGLAVAGTFLLPGAAAADYEAAVLAKKPVAFWRVGAARGAGALDRSGNGHKGTAHGTPAFLEPGAIQGDQNTAVRLDGRKSYIEISNDKTFSVPTSG